MILFESRQFRRLTLSPDGRYLYAVNTPDNRLERLRRSSMSSKTQPFLDDGLDLGDR
jgi:hypothetical protein